MEACDDIAYSVIDAEDTVKKGYASFYDLMDFLDSNSAGDKAIAETVKKSREKNQEFRKESLSSRELNDISMLMFRVKAISIMVVAATDVFGFQCKQNDEDGYTRRIRIDQQLVL